MTAGIRKAATLLASLPGPVASRLLEHLSPQNAAAIKAVAASSRQPAEAEQKRTLDEFLQLFSESQQTRPRPKRRRFDAPSSAVPPFHFLVPLPPYAILRLLNQELPQTFAAVLTQLPGPLVAEILALLTEERRIQVIRRLGSMGEVSEVALADLADVMATILKRRMPLRSNPTPRSGDILDQILAGSSGPIHRVLAESIREYRGTAEQSADDPPSDPGRP